MRVRVVVKHACELIDRRGDRGRGLAVNVVLYHCVAKFRPLERSCCPKERRCMHPWLARCMVAYGDWRDISYALPRLESIREGTRDQLGCLCCRRDDRGQQKRKRQSVDHPVGRGRARAQSVCALAFVPVPNELEYTNDERSCGLRGLNPRSCFGAARVFVEDFSV